MGNREIKDNPTFGKFKADAAKLQEARNLRHVLFSLGKDTKEIDAALIKLEEISKQAEELSLIPDKFNDLFSEHGWIFFESFDPKVAKRAIEIAEKDGTEIADAFLADYFSPAWVQNHIVQLEFILGFHERFALANKALTDYKEGRFYASTLVILSLIDGWVNTLNIAGFQRLGFFSKEVQLTAWDSIAAHPKGLMKLKETFSQPRKRTRVEEIHIPFRNGLFHGMDLGYDNKYVAAKSWAALFAVRELAIKARD